MKNKEEKTSQEITMDHQEDQDMMEETENNEEPTEPQQIRRSFRTNKGVTPNRYAYKVCMSNTEPKNWDKLFTL